MCSLNSPCPQRGIVVFRAVHCNATLRSLTAKSPSASPISATRCLCLPFPTPRCLVRSTVHCDPAILLHHLFSIRLSISSVPRHVCLPTHPLPGSAMLSHSLEETWHLQPHAWESAVLEAGTRHCRCAKSIPICTPAARVRICLGTASSRNG